MFPAVADIIRCPTEILSAGGVALGARTSPVPVVAAIIGGSSNCDAHDVSAVVSISVPKPLPVEPGELKVEERSSPIEMESVDTDFDGS